MEKKILIFISFLMMLYIDMQSCQGQDMKTDSVYLSLYTPTQKGIAILDKVLYSEHQWLEEKGTYIISQSIFTDSLASIKVNFDSTLRGIGLNNSSSKKYLGCVFYRKPLFFIDNTFRKNNLFFQRTASKKSFVDFGTTMIEVTNDKIVTWTFILADGQIISESISPLSTILNFDDSDCD